MYELRVLRRMIKERFENSIASKYNIRLYFVVNNPGFAEIKKKHLPSLKNIHTITATEDSAIEYISSKLYDKYENDFLEWCSANLIDSTQADSWSQYLVSVLGENKINQFTSDLAIWSNKFSRKEIAYLLDKYLLNKNNVFNFLDSTKETTATENDDIFEYSDKIKNKN